MSFDPILLSCPDCDFHTFNTDEFVDHRETEHPPSTISVDIPGVESEEDVRGL